MSWSIIEAWASLFIAIMLFSVLRHPTCVSCVAWKCCRMSNFIKHVCACPDLSFDRHWLYIFLHSLRSSFSPSRPLQLCFEAHCETSLARDIPAMQSTPKSRRGRYSFICLSVFVVLDDKREKLKTWHVLIRSFFGIRIRHASTFAVFSLELLVIQLHTLCLGLYFFAHSSRYDFLPSRKLQLWFRALCSTSSRFLVSNFY